VAFSHHPGDKPEDLVMALAHAKASAIKDKLAAAGENSSTGLLLTCDQVRWGRGYTAC